VANIYNFDKKYQKTGKDDPLLNTVNGNICSMIIPYLRNIEAAYANK
jgi:hypothetical protein